MMIVILILCGFVHILLNLRMGLAFQKIEDGVVTRLGVEKENAKLESCSLL